MKAKLTSREALLGYAILAIDLVVGIGLNLIF